MNSRRKQTIETVLVLIGCFLLSSIPGGLSTNQRTLYIEPITQGTGIPRAVLSSLFSLVALTAIPITLNLSVIRRKLGSYRAMGMVAFLVMGLGLFVGSYGEEWWSFLIYGYGIQLAIYFGTTAPVSGIVSNWFQKNTGVITGVLLSGGSLGGSLFAYLTGRWITDFGWRQSMFISGVITVAGGVVCMLILRDHPKGHVPPPQPVATEAEKKKRTGTIRLLKKKNFLFLGLATFFMMVGIQGMRLQSAPILIAAGNTTVQAATILSLMMIVSGAGSVAGGYITDKLGVRMTSLIVLSSASLGAGCLLFAEHRVAQLGFAVLFGVGFCALNILMPLHAGTMFLPEERDDVFSIGFSFSCAGTFVGMPIISLYYEWVGSYTGVIYLFMAIFMIAFLCYSRIRRSPVEPPEPDAALEPNA